MIRDTEDVVARAIALREECRKGVEERGVMPDYCDACIALKALAPKLLDAAQSLSDRIDVLTQALEQLIVDVEKDWGDPHTLAEARAALHQEGIAPK